MSARFANPLLLTSDIDASTRFYQDVLGLAIDRRADGFVLFQGGFALHDRDTMLKRIDQPYAAQGVGAVYYFEVPDLDAFWADHGAVLATLHPPRLEDWGGKVARIRDPEGHILEIGEPET